MDFNEAAQILKHFRASSLAKTLASIEKSAKGLTPKTYASTLQGFGAFDGCDVGIEVVAPQQGQGSSQRY